MVARHARLMVVPRTLFLLILMLVWLAAPAETRAQLTCDDFPDQQSAQIVFDEDPGQEHLDQDGNGIACEELITIDISEIAETSGNAAVASDAAGDDEVAAIDAQLPSQGEENSETTLTCEELLYEGRDFAQSIFDELTEDEGDGGPVREALDPDGNAIACDHDAFAMTKPPAPLVGAFDAPPATAQPIVLNGYLDGEMITARVGDVQETIRFIGIDTPDIERWECLGFRALDRVRDLLALDATYYIEYEPEVRDGEDRLYAYLWYPAIDGWRLISETMLEEGLAGFVEPDWEHNAYTGSLRTATLNAEDANLGIWGTCGGDGHKAISPCESVDPAIVDTIATQLDAGLWLCGAQGVRSPMYVHVYLIAADIEGPDMEGDDQVGVWWMPGGPDLSTAQLQAIQSLQGNAPQFSVFEEQGFLESAEAIGYGEAIDCVHENLAS